MSKLRFAVLALAIECSGSALTQTTDQRGACKADYDNIAPARCPAAAVSSHV